MPWGLFEMLIPEPQPGPSEFDYPREALEALFVISFPHNSNALTLEDRLPSDDLKLEA